MKKYAFIFAMLIAYSCSNDFDVNDFEVKYIKSNLIKDTKIFNEYTNYCLSDENCKNYLSNDFFKFIERKSKFEKVKFKVEAIRQRRAIRRKYENNQINIKQFKEEMSKIRGIRRGLNNFYTSEYFNYSDLFEKNNYLGLEDYKSFIDLKYHNRLNLEDLNKIQDSLYSFIDKFNSNIDYNFNGLESSISIKNNTNQSIEFINLNLVILFDFEISKYFYLKSYSIDLEKIWKPGKEINIEPEEIFAFSKGDIPNFSKHKPSSVRYLGFLTAKNDIGYNNLNKSNNLILREDNFGEIYSLKEWQSVLYRDSINDFKDFNFGEEIFDKNITSMFN